MENYTVQHWPLGMHKLIDPILIFLFILILKKKRTVSLPLEIEFSEAKSYHLHRLGLQDSRQRST